MLLFMTFVKALRLSLIALQTLASLLILGHGVRRWVINNR